MKNNSKLMLGLALAGTLSVVACKKKEDVKPAPVAPTPAGSVTPTTPVGPATPTTSKFQVTSTSGTKGLKIDGVTAKDFKTPQFSLKNAPKDAKQFVVIMQGDQNKPDVYWMARFSDATTDIAEMDQEDHSGDINMTVVPGGVISSKAQKITLTVFALKNPLAANAKYQTKDSETFRAKHSANILKEVSIEFQSDLKVNLDEATRNLEAEKTKLKAAKDFLKQKEAAFDAANTALVNYVKTHEFTKFTPDAKKADDTFKKLAKARTVAKKAVADAEVELYKIETPILTAAAAVTESGALEEGTYVDAKAEVTATAQRAGSLVKAEEALKAAKTALGL